MSDIKLFRISDGSATEIAGTSFTVERSLQKLIETHLDEFLGIRFLASEHSTGQAHGGRIDTLGIDENNFPVIIEYKRSSNENVITQGLFYLDWLMDHRAEFQLLVQKTFGQEVSESIEWGSPRLLCIAGDFTKYDEHAVQQMGRNIELIRYRRFGEELLLFEMVNSSSNPDTQAHLPQTFKGGDEKGTDAPTGSGSKTVYKTVTQYLAQSNDELKDLYHSLEDFLNALGDDVQYKELKYYFAFKRIKNFACIELFPQVKKIVVWTKIDPETVRLEEGFLRDVRSIGHYGTGDLEITLRTPQDLEKSKPFLLQSSNAS